jgi:hypothetical protein
VCLSAQKTTEAVREFKLFLYLAVLYPSHPCSPSQRTDNTEHDHHHHHLCHRHRANRISTTHTNLNVEVQSQ